MMKLPEDEGKGLRFAFDTAPFGIFDPHVVAVFDNETVRFYLNCQLAMEIPLRHYRLIANYALAQYRNHASQVYTAVVLDDFTVYSRAFTEEEVKAEYQRRVDELDA